MKSHAVATAMCVAAFVAMTCGGRVKPGDGGSSGSGAQPGTGGGGGVAGTGAYDGGPAGDGGMPAGAGGGPAGGGGMPAGAGGGPAGGGGMPAGAGGGPAGGGGMPAGAGGGPDCPPAPSCNWCNGVVLYDSQGCVAGYQCANGVDPCQTQPCGTSGDCGPGEVCAPDGLCWGPEPSCADPACAAYGDACNCTWSCSDNNLYETQCKFVGAQETCECYLNNQPVVSCAMGAAGAPCESDCCGFPE